MWLLIPIALVAAALLGRKGRAPGTTPQGPSEAPGPLPATTKTEKPDPVRERVLREMALNLHLSGKRFGIWRESSGVLMQVAFSNDDLEKDFRELPINPNQALYYWDSKVSTREPKAVRVRLMS